MICSVDEPKIKTIYTTMALRQKCWLDCDPGHDDAFAIILAAYSPQLELLGISCSAGNQTIEKTTKNTLNVVNVSGIHVPVFAGTVL